MSALCNQPLPFSTIAVAAAAAAVVATTISERPVKKNIDEMGQMDSECFNIIHIENHSFRVFHFGYDLLTRNWIVSCSLFMCGGKIVLYLLL